MQIRARISHLVSWLADSWLYHGGTPASSPASSLAWLPAAGDFLAGLQQLGWKADGVQPASAQTAVTPVTAAFLSPLKGPKQDKPGPQLHNLQLLWRFLAAVCRKVMQSKLGFEIPQIYHHSRSALHSGHFQFLKLYSATATATVMFLWPCFSRLTIGKLFDNWQGESWTAGSAITWQIACLWQGMQQGSTKDARKVYASCSW